MWPFRKEKVQAEPIFKYRVTKEEWPNGRVNFTVEEWTSHYACHNKLWLPLDVFKTHAEATAFLDKHLTPEPVPVLTVVETR